MWRLFISVVVERYLDILSVSSVRFMMLESAWNVIESLNNFDIHSNFILMLFFLFWQCFPIYFFINFHYRVIPAPLRNGASSSKGNLGFTGQSRFSNFLSLNFSNSLTMPEIYNSYCKKVIPNSICNIYFSRVEKMISNKNSIIKKGFPNTIIIKD